SDQQFERQVNVAGDTNIQVQPQQDGVVLFNQALQFLKARAYQQAISTLKEAIKVDPTIRSAYFYLAVALLKGKRPKVLVRSEVQEIDELLCTAISMDSSDGLFHWFRALILDDYYTANYL